MSGAFDAASTVSVLLGLALFFIALVRYADDIVVAVTDLGGWLVNNAVGIIAFLFLISLFVTAIAAAGLV